MLKRVGRRSRGDWSIAPVAYWMTTTSARSDYTVAS